MERRSLDCDVLVVGGGPAGILAAVAAARESVRVLLIEKSDRLGGIAVQAPLSRICGLYGTGKNPPVSTLNGGLAEEVALRLERRSPSLSRARAMGRVWVLPFNPPDLEACFRDLVHEQENLDLLVRAAPESVVTRHEEVEEVRVACEGGPIQVRAIIVIDATGQAHLSALAGAERMSLPEPHLQLAGCLVQATGVEDDPMMSVKVPYHLRRAANDGVLPRNFRFTMWDPVETCPGQGFLKFSIPAQLDDREDFAKKYVPKAVEYLRNHYSAFRSARCEIGSVRVLDREGGRILGEYVLTEEDVLSGRAFEDAVARNAWPVEFWDPDKGPVYRYLPEGICYEIPFRCLRPARMRNLLAAGQCLSATQAAHASARVMGTCMALGEAAGQAAAIFIRKGIWKPEASS